MNGLYTSTGEFIEFSQSEERELLTTELASRQSAGGFSPAMALGQLPDPDPVLRKRGDGVAVLDDLLADDEVTQAVQGRKLMTLNKRHYQFVPGAPAGDEPEPEAKGLCDALIRDLEDIDMDVLISGILDAPYYGMTPIELTFAPDGGRLKLVQAEPKPVEWFVFNDENKLMFRGEYFSNPQPVHPYKFVLVRHFPTYKNPYGLRLLSRCLWPVAFKRGGIEFWTRFCEKFGQPWMLGTAKANATRAEMNAMAADLASMVQDAVAVVPGGAKVEALQFSGKGEAHSSYVQYWDKAINKVIKGQTLTSDMGSGHSNAAAQTHYNVLEGYGAADMQLVVTAMNNIAWTYTKVNMPPTEGRRSRSTFSPVFGYVEPKDYKAQIELDKGLKGVGVKFKKPHFVQTYSLAEDEFELEGEESKDEPKKHSGSESFAAKPDADQPAEPDAYQQQIDAFLEEVLPEAVSQNEKFMAAVQQAVEKAESWEDMQLLLEEYAPQGMTEDEQTEFMTNVLSGVAMFGQYAAGETND
ncbi:phage portal protein family protein [Halodesulfovibrio aestuarii]|uniref:phage portal protein family protein n=1 Tax=Halodesulfovibrio aestuarii TaxID=126333 RepID=UPI003D348649